MALFNFYNQFFKKSSKIEKDFKLIDGNFTKKEAAVVLKDVLDAKINFHKLQKIGELKADNNTVNSLNNYRMQQLIKEKENVKEFLESLELDNCKIQITSTINISIQK